MIKLSPEQLSTQLKEGLRAVWLLLGNDPLMLQESQEAILHAARSGIRRTLQRTDRCHD